LTRTSILVVDDDEDEEDHNPSELGETAFRRSHGVREAPVLELVKAPKNWKTEALEVVGEEEEEDGRMTSNNRSRGGSSQERLRSSRAKSSNGRETITVFSIERRLEMNSGAERRSIIGTGEASVVRARKKEEALTVVIVASARRRCEETKLVLLLFVWLLLER
jgi:hypothetical protein